MLSITPVTFSGSSGTRLWSNSEAEYPKRYLSLTSTSSLIQQTVDRFKSIRSIELPVTLAHHQYRSLACEQLIENGCDQAEVMLPSIVLQRRCKGLRFLIRPTDHSINVESAFHSAADPDFSVTQETDQSTVDAIDTDQELDLMKIELQPACYLGSGDTSGFNDVYGRLRD
jgi:mannose-1-phosphate guanylyltransferase